MMEEIKNWRQNPIKSWKHENIESDKIKVTFRVSQHFSSKYLHGNKDTKDIYHVSIMEVEFPVWCRDLYVNMSREESLIVSEIVSERAIYDLSEHHTEEFDSAEEAQSYISLIHDRIEDIKNEEVKKLANNLYFFEV